MSFGSLKAILGLLKFIIFGSKSPRDNSTLLDKMKYSKNFDEWYQYGKEYEAQKDITKWKAADSCSIYDWHYVKKVSAQIDCCLRQQDFTKLMHILRGCVSRKFANILDPRLYTLTGTKKLIENFQSKIIECLQIIADQPESEIPEDEKISFFKNLKQTYGKTALFLSGGGNIAMYHYGVTRALWEKGLLPTIITGSSGGALVAALVCCKNEKELGDMYADPKTGISCKAWYEPQHQQTFFEQIKFILKEGYIMNPLPLKHGLLENIGNLTFKEAYEKTGRVLNINVTGSEKHSHDVLLNHLTAPNVLVWSAVWASCGLPFILGPVGLFCKDSTDKVYPFTEGHGRKFIDGSIGGDIPFQEISVLFNVKNSIVSQTNPWIYPFLSDDKLDTSSMGIMFEKIKRLVRHEVKTRAKQFRELGILPKILEKYINIVTQRYSGNINIWPETKIKDMLEILNFPNHERLTRCYYGGSRRTYPKMSQIAANMLIERALESHLLKVRSTSSLSRSPSSISNLGNTSFSSTEENEKVLNFEHGKGKSIFDVLNTFDKMLTTIS